MSEVTVTLTGLEEVIEPVVEEKLRVLAPLPEGWLTRSPEDARRRRVCRGRCPRRGLLQRTIRRYVALAILTPGMLGMS